MIRAVTYIIPARYFVSTLQSLFLAGNIPVVLGVNVLFLSSAAVMFDGLTWLKPSDGWLNMCMDNCRRRPDKAFTPPSGIMHEYFALSGLQAGLRGRTCFIVCGFNSQEPQSLLREPQTRAEDPDSAGADSGHPVSVRRDA